VDTGTGRVSIRRYVWVDDVGQVGHPLVVDGQVHGGLVQGIARALFEEAGYDEPGPLVTVEGTSPPSDGSADADYRGHLARVLTGRAVAMAVGTKG
jgi:aerobic carbon-monoxide dehydrogenase large subunit